MGGGFDKLPCNLDVYEKEVAAWGIFMLFYWRCTCYSGLVLLFFFGLSSICRQIFRWQKGSFCPPIQVGRQPCLNQPAGCHSDIMWYFWKYIFCVQHSFFNLLKQQWINGRQKQSSGSLDLLTWFTLYSSVMRRSRLQCQSTRMTPMCAAALLLLLLLSHWSFSFNWPSCI